jgi:hypothetical protein
MPNHSPTPYFQCLVAVYFFLRHASRIRISRIGRPFAGLPPEPEPLCYDRIDDLTIF